MLEKGAKIVSSNTLADQLKAEGCSIGHVRQIAHSRAEATVRSCRVDASVIEATH